MNRVCECRYLLFQHRTPFFIIFPSPASPEGLDELSEVFGHCLGLVEEFCYFSVIFIDHQTPVLVHSCCDFIFNIFTGRF